MIPHVLEKKKNLTYDAKAIEAGLWKLRELFKQAHEFQCKVYNFESSDYGKLGNKIGEFITLMEEHNWDAESVLKTAADSRLRPNGKRNTLAIDRSRQGGWEKDMLQRLEILGVK